MLLDRELRYVAANPAYETAVMRRQSELLGRRIDEAFPNPGASGKRLISSLLSVIETGRPDTLAYIPYEIPVPGAQGCEFETRYWTAVHSPLLDEKGEVLFVLQNTVDISELVKLREAATVPFRILPGELELIQRAREAEEAYRSVRDTSAAFRRLFENAPGMVAVLQGERHVFTFANEAYQRFIGRPVLGMPMREALPEMEGQGVFEMLDEVFYEGRVRVLQGYRLLLRRQGDQPMEETFLDFSYHPIQEASGTITGIFVQAYERTGEILFQQRQRLLLDELNHRVKNTLSTVQSIARQSFRGVQDPALAQQAFDSRIQALSKAHDVLSDRHWESAELTDILMQELAVYGAERVTASGALTQLKPKAAIAFAMVFHELSSNASKYGGLATPGGAVSVVWSRSSGPDGRLLVEWTEAGFDTGELALVPGFGLRMLQRIITGELDGTLELAFRRDGLICRIEVPLMEVETVASVDAG